MMMGCFWCGRTRAIDEGLRCSRIAGQKRAERYSHSRLEATGLAIHALDSLDYGGVGTKVGTLQ